MNNKFIGERQVVYVLTGYKSSLYLEEFESALNGEKRLVGYDKLTKKGIPDARAKAIRIGIQRTEKAQWPMNIPFRYLYALLDDEREVKANELRKLVEQADAEVVRLKTDLFNLYIDKP